MGSAAEDKREQRLKLLEDHIGHALAESQRNGELASARTYGRPLDLGDGYDETPAELRMAHKMLKDAGFVPPEVEAMRQIAALQARIDGAPEAADAPAWRLQLTDLRQSLALKMERLRHGGNL